MTRLVEEYAINDKQDLKKKEQLLLEMRKTVAKTTGGTAPGSCWCMPGVCACCIGI